MFRRALQLVERPELAPLSTGPPPARSATALVRPAQQWQNRPMKVELIESVDEFIATSSAFRAADPLADEHHRAAWRSRSPTVTGAYEDYHWWIVRDDDGEVVGIAMRTSPFNMMISSMPTTPRVRSGDSVGEFDDDVPGTLGIRRTSSRRSSRATSNRTAPARPVSSSSNARICCTSWKNSSTPDVEGFGRPARSEEIELLARMFVDFIR